MQRQAALEGARMVGRGGDLQLHQRGDQRAQMIQHAVVRRRQNAAVKGDVASRHQLGVTTAGLQRRTGGGDAGPLRRRRPQRGEPAGRRLHDQAELDQIEGVRQALADRVQPTQHVRVEQMPIGARPHPCAAARPDLDQALAGQSLHRLAQQIAADPQLAGEIGLDGERRRRRELPRRNSLPELMDDLAVEIAPRRPWRGRRRRGHRLPVDQAGQQPEPARSGSGTGMTILVHARLVHPIIL